MTPRETAYSALEMAREALDADSDAGDTALERVAAHLVEVARMCSDAREAAALRAAPRCIVCDETGHVAAGRSICDHCLLDCHVSVIESALIAHGVAS
jgi:hypothetical protein